MPVGADRDYYVRREANARDLANKAIDPQIKQIHSDMADAYAEKARAAADQTSTP